MIYVINILSFIVCVPFPSLFSEQREQEKSQDGPAPSSRSRISESGGNARHTPPVPTDEVTPAPSSKPNWAEEGGNTWGGQTSTGPYQVRPSTPSASTDTPLESVALATTSMLRVTLMTVTSLEGHVKYSLDAFACMQGRRPGHGGPREQPSPPPGSLLGQGPISYYRQVHGEGAHIKKEQDLPSDGRINETLEKIFICSSEQIFVGIFPNNYICLHCVSDLS